MPFCPHCRYEYEAGVSECPDCLVKLVVELLEEVIVPVEEEEYVELHTLPGKVYAEMVQEVLEKEGIECVIKTDVLASGLLADSAHVAGSECRILVLKRHQKQAAKILNDMMDHF
jgi:hypothetical protein